MSISVLQDFVLSLTLLTIDGIAETLTESFPRILFDDKIYLLGVRSEDCISHYFLPEHILLLIDLNEVLAFTMLMFYLSSPKQYRKTGDALFSTLHITYLDHTRRHTRSFTAYGIIVLSARSLMSTLNSLSCISFDSWLRPLVF